jgi:hypothetical protein
LVSPAEASIHPHIPHCQRLNRCRGKADSEIGKLDAFSSSTYAPSANPHVRGTGLGRESPAKNVARESSSLRTRVAERGRASAKHTVKEPKPNLKMPVRLASLEGAAPPVQAIPSRIPSSPLTGLGRQKPARIVAREWSSLQSSTAEHDGTPAKHAAKEPSKSSLKPPVRLATFLPAADISHRDFVTHAWADNPIKEILVRIDDASQRIETARTTGSSSGRAVASGRKKQEGR